MKYLAKQIIDSDKCVFYYINDGGHIDMCNDIDINSDISLTLPSNLNYTKIYSIILDNKTNPIDVICETDYEYLTVIITDRNNTIVAIEKDKYVVDVVYNDENLNYIENL